MRIPGKFTIEKSADISQNVHLNVLFQNLKKSYMGFFLSLRGPSTCGPTNVLSNFSYAQLEQVLIY